MSGMQGKVVVLTGGTSGIGEAAAIRLASMGARSVLVARDASRAETSPKRQQPQTPPEDVAWDFAPAYCASRGF